jgi:Phosducin
MPTSEAQEEFNALIYGTGRTSPSAPRPEDRAAHDDTDSKSSSPPSKTIRSASQMHQHYDSDSDTTPPASSGAAAKMRPKYYIPHVRSEANTGPKGVIADAQAFQIARLAHRSAAASRANLTVPAAYDDEAKESMERPQSWLLDEDEESDEDDEFLMRWRQNRLREMAVHARRNARSRSAAGAAKFGSLVAVDAEGYLDAIEKVGRDTVVVVFIYDERVSSSWRIVPVFEC